jgi:hypothetical protein
VHPEHHSTVHQRGGRVWLFGMSDTLLHEPGEILPQIGGIRVVDRL